MFTIKIDVDLDDFWLKTILEVDNMHHFIVIVVFVGSSDHVAV